MKIFQSQKEHEFGYFTGIETFQIDVKSGHWQPAFLALLNKYLRGHSNNKCDTFCLFWTPLPMCHLVTLVTLVSITYQRFRDLKKVENTGLEYDEIDVYSSDVQLYFFIRHNCGK